MVTSPEHCLTGTPREAEEKVNRQTLRRKDAAEVADSWYPSNEMKTLASNTSDWTRFNPNVLQGTIGIYIGKGVSSKSMV